MKTNLQKQKGAVVIVAVIFFLLISVTLLLAVFNPIADQVRASTNYVNAAQSYVTAETLNDDSLYRLDKGLSLPSSLSLTLNNATSTATVSDFGDSKQITSQGTSHSLTRSVQSIYSITTGTSFYYGLQTGTGGINMTGGAGILGNVFSNGGIIGTTGTYITGGASVATVSSPSDDQSNGTSTTPSTQIDFGGQPAWNVTLPTDAAQSFKASSTAQLTSLRLYMKKSTSGWMNDITVKVVNDNAGSPGATVLASAALPAASVGTSFGYNTISFSSGPTLTSGTQYWIVLDTSNTYGAWYSWAATSGAYTNGAAKTGTFGGSWAATSPTNLDAYFDVYLGGSTGYLSGVSVGSSGGDAYAHEINNASISNTAYCQISSGSTNKSCDTSKPDPSVTAFPIVQSQIDGWKATAQSGTSRSSWSLGSNTSTSTAGAMVINGDLTVGGGATLTLNGVLYVTGNINLNGGAKIQLGTSMGTGAGVIIVDGTTSLSGGAYVTGNGMSGSYIFLISTNTSCANGGSCSTYAIDASGGTGSVVLVAQSGGIQFSGGASAKSAVANYMTMNGGTTLKYDTGLASVSFSSGPGGSWSVNSWKEIAQ